MLTILGEPRTVGFCDQLSRRSFLRVGALATGGLTLPGLLQAEQAAGIRNSRKSVILIYLPGGPPHQDMFDLKPTAAAEFRGEFQPIATRVPGIEICELLPQIAERMDKCVAIRSVVGSIGDHASFQCLTGRRPNPSPQGGWPEFGSCVSRLFGPTSPAVPPFVGLSPKMQHRPYNSGKPGFLGPAHTPFQPNGEGRGDMVLNGVSLDRLDDRKSLVRAVDRFRADLDGSGMMEGADAFQQQALGMLTSSRLAEALDLSREDATIRQRYGRGTDRHQGDGAPRLMEQFLMARRLVEAGVRVVTLSFSFWDWHGQNFRNARENLPAFDQGISALVDDLHRLGLQNDVTVLAWGEFGRTPKINNDVGRDHWPNVSCALLAGGGLRTGQVIGSTDKIAGEAKDRPVHFQEVIATLYNRLGIDVGHTTVPDFSGRPQYLVEPNYTAIREIV